MKTAILISEGSAEVKNIGDYIQSIAGAQFFDVVDCYLERETLKDITSSEKVNCIMNGWYMWCPESFPPSKDVNPLYVSMHISPSVADRMLTKDSIEHLKTYAPIGARDVQTQRLLASKGIESYLSGCLTLTLDRTFKTAENNHKTYIVEPYIDFGTSKSKLIRYCKGFYYFLKYYSVTKTISKKYDDEVIQTTKPGSIKRYILKIIRSSFFYQEYRSCFDDEIMIDSTYVSHVVRRDEYPTVEQMMNYAKDLLMQYSKAGLVITSRIHCALPCLSLETPFIFVSSEELASDSYRPSGRFEGLVDMFNQMNISNCYLEPVSEILKKELTSGKIRTNHKLINPSKYKVFQKTLKATVCDWVANLK